MKIAVLSSLIVIAFLWSQTSVVAQKLVDFSSSDSIEASLQDETGVEVDPNEEEGSMEFQFFEDASEQIRKDLVSEMATIEMPATKKARVVNMVLEAYRMNGHFPLWDHLQNNEVSDLAIRNLLNFHGIPDKLAISVSDGGEQYLSESSPVPTDDLRVSMRLAESCLLLKEGPHDIDLGWGDKWAFDDDEGEADSYNQKRRLSYHFAITISEKPDSLIGVAMEYLPKNWIYRRLLEEYVRHDGGAEPPEMKINELVKVNDPFAYAEELAIYFQEEGYISESGLEEVLIASEPTFSKALSDGVKKFQQSKGIDSDGILGPQTAKRISLNSEDKRNQILLNLHRARFLPNNPGERHLVVNLPSAKVYGFDQDALSIESRVVFGKNKEGSRTPIFRDQMEFVVFRPYWVIPTAVATREYLGRIAGDKDYLKDNDYEIVSDDGEVVEPSIDSIRAIADKSYYLRQKAGEENTMGLVKFLFPNEHSVSLHDTNAKNEFGEDYRAFSQGSMRLQEPDELAKWVLNDHKGWNSYAVNKALKDGDNKWVKLKKPIPVYIVYFTAFPNMGQGAGVQYHRDYYKRDRVDQAGLKLSKR